MKKRLILLVGLFMMNFFTLNAQNNSKPQQIGDIFDLNLSISSNGINKTKSGIVYQKTFKNEGSGYVKLHLNSFDLLPGDFVKVYSPITKEEYIYAEQGKIVGSNKEMISEFWTGIIFSDTIIIEFYSKNNSQSHSGFNIDSVAYGYTPERINAVYEGLENNASRRAVCSVDDKEPIVCYDGTEMGEKAKAVCRLQINGASACTGWLLGCEGDVMTNNHCIGDAADANNTDFIFNYQHTDCDGTINAANDVVANAAAFVQTNATLDFTLVTLPVNPTATYGYLSLSSVAVTNGERIYIPQHPGGRRKEIAVNTDIGGDPNGFSMVTNAGTGIAGARVEYLADTEGGSSGSPVLRFNDNLVVAIHNTGGCPNGSYGRSDQLIAAIGANMPNCGIDDNNATPLVSFTSTTATLIEGSTCGGFTDVTVPIIIGEASNQEVTVNVSVNIASTAINNVDYQLLSNTVTFAQNTATPQSVVVRVFEDMLSETTETIVLDFVANTNGGDATVGLSTTSIVINDDDLFPTPTTITTLLDSDFETGDTTAWNQFDLDGDGQAYAITTSINYGVAVNGRKILSASDLAPFGTPGNLTPDNLIFSDIATLIPADAINASLSYGIAGFADSEPYTTYWSTDKTSAGTLTSGATSVQVNAGNTLNGGGQIIVTDMSLYAGQSGHIVFRHTSPETNTSGLLLIDNITLSAEVNNEIHTAVNLGTSSDSGDIPGSGIVYAYDAISQNLMLDINNVSGADYGCTDLSISRAGASGQAYNGGTGASIVTDKTYTITPTTLNSNEDSTISFYFTEAEIAGWEVAASSSRNNLVIIKDDGSAIEEVIATITSYGIYHKVTGNFTTGINGTYYFGDAAVLNTSEFSFDNFVLYPNPTKGSVNVRFNTTDNVDVNLYDIRGRSVYTKSFNKGTRFNQELTFNNLSAGIYVIKINSGGNTMFKKLIIK